MTMDVRAQAAAVVSVSDLARVLRELRDRLARRGSPLSYRQIAERAHISSGAVGIYLTGARLPSEERFAALVEVLGADPTERAALMSARRRLGAAAASASPPGVAQAPRALPAQPAGFTGRGEQLMQLDELVNAETRPARFAAVTGMAGVGKTALALHWAHGVTPHFPDGQLYVDLHTYSSGPALSSMDSLGVLLTALGADLDGLSDLTTRSLRYQTLLRGRSMVVVLDNVGSVDQVVQLLPPPPCVAVVTSRDELADLDDAVQVRRFALDGMSDVEAMELLRLLIGPRVDQEPQAARAVATRCAHLPLALRIVAEHAAARPHSSLSELAAELAGEEAGGLDAFEVPGDRRADLRSVFSWSLHRLPYARARTFLLLGLVPGLDVDRYGLAALAGVEPAEADELAGGLMTAHLLESRGVDRFAMHDLLRVYAQALARRELDADDRQAAMTRLLDYYLSAVVAATDTVYPNENPTPGAVRSLSATEVAIPDLSGLATAVAWLKAERVNIVAAAVDATRHGRARYTLAIALRIWIFLEQAHSDDAITFHAAALAAADDLGHAADPTDRAKLLGALALAHHRLGDIDEATARAEESIALLHRAGHKQGGILGRYILASVRSAQGRYLEVLAIFEQTLDFARVHGPAAQVMPLINMGKANLALERHETAADCFREAADIAVAEALGHHIVEARRGMAMVLVRLERFAEALPMAEEAVEVTREYGYPDRLVAMLDTLAWAHRGLGQFSKAFDNLAEAIQICEGMAGSYRAAQVRNTLGETHRAAGDHLSARDCHEEAMELAESARDRKQRARALTGLGDAHAALGDIERARDCWKRAFDEYTDMGLPAAARVEARLRDARS